MGQTLEEKILAKLNGHTDLTESELKYFVWEMGKQVDEIEGEDHRWQREVKTIIEIDGKLYAVDWRRGLTESQESDFWEQPYEVERHEEVVTKTVVNYVRV